MDSRVIEKQYFKRTLMMKNAFLRGWICVFAKKVVPLQALNACAALSLRLFGGKAAGLRLLELGSV